MKTPKDQKPLSAALRSLNREYQMATKARGNTLLYVLVLLVIFSVLGTTMVSLFSSSVTSSATPNDARRAAYAKESGMRYAFSELRNSDFETATINRLNSTNSFTFGTGKSFSINIFGPWFESTTWYSGTPGTLRVTVPEGKLPAGFSIPAGLWAVNYEYLDPDDLKITSVRSDVSSFAKIDNTTLDITINGDFSINKGERLCLAVEPSESTQTIASEGGNLYVESVAKDFFPPTNGAININRVDYVYERLVDEGTRVRLENLSASSMPNQTTPFPFTVENKTNGTYSGDFIVLSPRNHIVIPTGTSDTVTVGGTLEDGINIYDTATAKEERSGADIDWEYDPNLDASLSQKETDTGFINVDNTEKTVNIGGGGSTSDEFGGVWWGADKTIGGKNNFCLVGKCEFGLGVRAFFTLDYSGDGEGLTFALLNGALNDRTSSGGDIDLAELIGYAGDSRTVTNPASGSDYLDGIGNGLRPPKIAMEFDTRTDNSNFQYCNPVASSDPADSQQNSRNDPLTTDRDAVQYVFWGFDPTLFIPCRDDKPSYDDNRHDSGESVLNWTIATTGEVRSTPAVADDGTIYVGSNDGNVYAINSDGSSKGGSWPFATAGAVRSSPAIGSDGTIFIGSDDGNVYAINPDGSSGGGSWPFTTGGAVRSSPAIGSDGTIFIGSDDGNVYALTPGGSKQWEYATGDIISLGRPAIGPTGTIHVTSGNTLFALYPPDRFSGLPFGTSPEKEWTFDLQDVNDYAPGIDPISGTIYSDELGNEIRALNSDGTSKWVKNVGSDIDSTPVVGDDGVIYFGTDAAQSLFALEPVNGNVIWQFPTGGEVDTTPAIAPDGTILIVSNDGNLYAVNPDGTEKWSFPIPVTPGLPNSSPAVGNNGLVYVGSSDTNLYAINNFADPRNIKEKYVTSRDDGSNDRVAEEIVTLDAGNKEDWLRGAAAKGPWAIRMEVMRGDTATAGKYEYTLHAWVRQCNQTDCSDVLGTFYQDTRIEYNTTSQRTVHLEQTVELIPADHTQFDRFLFGFTGALVANDDQSALIDNFQLSFIRPNDPFILSDEDWPAP